MTTNGRVCVVFSVTRKETCHVSVTFDIASLCEVCEVKYIYNNDSK